MNLQKMSALFEAMLQVLEAGGSEVDEGDVSTFLQLMYSQATSKYQPVVQALPSIAGLVAKDISPIVNTCLSVVNDVRSDDKVQAAFARSGVLKAQMRKKSLDSYIEAGFHRDESMALVLQDVANAKAFLHHVGSSNSSSQKSG